jgi:hypothetical protein
MIVVDFGNAAIGLSVIVIVPMVMIYLRHGITGSTASFLATTRFRRMGVAMVFGSRFLVLATATFLTAIQFRVMTVVMTMSVVMVMVIRKVSERMRSVFSLVKMGFLTITIMLRT